MVYNTIPYNNRNIDVPTGFDIAQHILCCARSTALRLQNQKNRHDERISIRKAR